ncbi:MAG: hypothetical protein E6417_08320 [Bradyrhizobium sp.]|nr:hypothetical protein [Bradyrhizobium sp.]
MSDLDTGHASSSRLWLLATVAAVALHLGGAALALTSFKNDEDAGGLGAAGAEVIDIDMGSPKVDNDEVPVGQDAPLQNAAPEMQEQKAEVEQTDLPKDVPTTTEEADREVTTSDVKKPTEEQKVATVQTQASEAQESSQESARKSLDDKAPES